MDFYLNLLKESGFFEKNPRFLIKTTASSRAWDEWAIKNRIPVINTPVGFKEIARVLRKIEKKMKKSEKITIKDAFGNIVRIGDNPRLLFAGEESGGMILGPKKIIRSFSGREIIAMREKSAGEASIVLTALVSKLYLEDKDLIGYLKEILKKNNITHKFFVADYVIFYNESEPDPIKLAESKRLGEIKRDKIDSFFRSIAIANLNGIISLEDVKRMLEEAINLDFENLKKIDFVGDGTYLDFGDMFLEIRKSGTEAKIKAYSSGNNLKKCQKYIKYILNYDGHRTESFKKLIPKDLEKNIYKITRNLYLEYLNQL